MRHRVLEACGGENFTRHDLRRTVSSGMVRIGVAAGDADRALGHVLKGSARAYIHGPRLVESARALWRWDEHLQGLLGRKGAKVVPFAMSRTSHR